MLILRIVNKINFFWFHNLFPFNEEKKCLWGSLKSNVKENECDCMFFTKVFILSHFKKQGLYPI